MKTRLDERLRELGCAFRAAAEHILAFAVHVKGSHRPRWMADSRLCPPHVRRRLVYIDPVAACIEVLNRTCDAVALILETAESLTANH